jgi:glucoamylase
VLADPHRFILLAHTKVEIFDETLRGRLRLYALLAPQGVNNSARCSEVGGVELIQAQRETVHLVIGSSCGFTRRSVGYVGASDGWQDLMNNFKMDWEFRSAERGNIALTGEIEIPDNGEFTVAIPCGGSYQSTAAKLLQSLAEPFELHRQGYVRQWQRAVVNSKFDFSAHTSDGGSMYRLSRCVLLAHEDKLFQGAMVASMSIPGSRLKPTTTAAVIISSGLGTWCRARLRSWQPARLARRCAL